MNQSAEATISIIKAEFEKGLAEYDAAENPSSQQQVVFVGRSNAGKSTLLNRIVKKKKLARTSKLPGRTQQINYFNCTLRNKETAKEKNFTLIDLPGYGYAVASKAKKGELSRMLVNYLSQGEAIKICLLIQDIRRDVTHEELAIRKLLFERDILVQPVLTKADKLRSGEKKERVKSIAKQYGLEISDVHITGEGMALETILTVCDEVLV